MLTTRRPQIRFVGSPIDNVLYNLVWETIKSNKFRSQGSIAARVARHMGLRECKKILLDLETRGLIEKRGHINPTWRRLR